MRIHVPRSRSYLIWIAAAMAPMGWSVAAAATSYIIQTVAGGDFSGCGGPATAAIFGQLQGVALDFQGSLYVADAIDHRVRKITPDGVIRTIAGTGVAGFGGDGGPGPQAQLNAPYGVAVDRAGNVYIADLGN